MVRLWTGVDINMVTQTTITTTIVKTHCHWISWCWESCFRTTTTKNQITRTLPRDGLSLIQHIRSWKWCIGFTLSGLEKSEKEKTASLFEDWNLLPEGAKISMPSLRKQFLSGAEKKKLHHSSKTETFCLKGQKFLCLLWGSSFYPEQNPAGCFSGFFIPYSTGVRYWVKE